jgi:hypothetical protein
MAAFLKYMLRVTGILGVLGLFSYISSNNVADTAFQKLSALDLQPLEYNLDVSV